MDEGYDFDFDNWWNSLLQEESCLPEDKDSNDTDLTELVQFLNYGPFKTGRKDSAYPCDSNSVVGKNLSNISKYFDAPNLSTSSFNRNSIPATHFNDDDGKRERDDIFDDETYNSMLQQKYEDECAYHNIRPLEKSLSDQMFYEDFFGGDQRKTVCRLL